MRSGAGFLRRLSGLAVLAALFLAACGPSSSGPEPSFTQVNKITASDGEDYDLFGWSVAFDGSQLLVGSKIGQYSFPDGQAYLFLRHSGGMDRWGEVKRFSANDGLTFDQFGAAVALAGDAAFIGAPQEDDVEINAGAVHVFVREQGGAGEWGEAKRLAASDGEQGAYFGQALSAGGDSVFVGAPGNSAAAPGGGAAYVFIRDLGGSDNWGEAAKIVPSDPRAAARFGCSVALDGDVAVIGAHGDGVPGALFGAAYIFYRIGQAPGTWQEIRKLTAHDQSDWDGFGSCVAISGDLVLVGAPWKHEAGIEYGAAYLYGRNQGGPDNWGLVKKFSALVTKPNDGFGTSVTLSAEYLLIGAPGVDGSGGPPANALGAVYVFRRDLGGNDNWGLLGRITPADRWDSGEFGRSTALAGDLVTVGAPIKPEGGVCRGAVYLFRIEP